MKMKYIIICNRNGVEEILVTIMAREMAKSYKRKIDSSKQHYFTAVEGLPSNNICIKMDSVLVTGLVSLDMQLV